MMVKILVAILPLVEVFKIMFVFVDVSIVYVMKEQRVGWMYIKMTELTKL